MGIARDHQIGIPSWIVVRNAEGTEHLAALVQTAPDGRAKAPGSQPGTVDLVEPDRTPMARRRLARRFTSCSPPRSNGKCSKGCRGFRGSRYPRRIGTTSRARRSPTKDGEERRVPMTPRLAESLRSLRHLKGALIFSQPDGTPLDPWRLARILDRACTRAGLRRIRRHDCRHGFASQLVTAGVPLPQVQAWLGHSTIHMTMRYAHLSPNNGSEWIRALDPSFLRQPDGNRGTVAS